MMGRQRKNKAGVANIDAKRSRYHVDAFSRGLKILGVFTPERKRARINELSAAAGVLPSTTFRIVMTLCDLGYLRATPEGEYELGLACLELGYSALAGQDLPEVALPILQRLQQETGESVYLSLPIGDEMVDILSLRRAEVRSTVGQSFPVYSTPGGKAWLAAIGEQQSSEVLGKIDLIRRGPRTITDREELQRDLAETRRRGYSYAEEESSPGHAGIGIPLLDASGACIAAVALLASLGRVTPEQIISDLLPKVKAAAEAVSQRLRYQFMDAR